MTGSEKIRKVALLTDGVHPLVLGGMQKHSFYLLQSLLDNEVDVVLVHPGKDSIRTHLNEDVGNKLTEIIIPFPKGFKLPGSYLRDSFRYSSAIYSALKDINNIDFIYAQGFTAWASLDGKRKGINLAPIGVNFHGLEMFQYAEGLKQRFIQRMFKGPVRFNLKNADVVYSLGGKLTEILHEIVPNERVSVIPIALDKDWLRNEKKDFSDASSRKFIFIGRYERRKGVEELNKVIHDDDTSTFHFVGPIPEGKKLRKDNVHYHGKVMETEKLKRIIDDCHVIIVPSLSEGMPTVILEGMARGLAVIGTDVGAVSELVSENNGVLIHPGDTKALSEAVLKMRMLNETDLQLMSEHSMRVFQSSHVWDRVVELTLKDLEHRFPERKA